jgi:peptide/nickel transport system permease protein
MRFRRAKDGAASPETHPVRALLISRIAAGLLTLLVVSIIVFLATEVLPGNAAYAILGHTATPSRLRALEAQLHLNRGVFGQYWAWLSSLLSGHLGTSLSDGQPVWQVVGPRLLNSAALVVLAGVIGTAIGVGLGIFAALRRDKAVDHGIAVASLAITSLPEFVIAIVLIILFATSVFHLLPAVSLVSPGTKPWSHPNLLVLPVATLVIVIVPYILRMMRGATIEALESDYVEMARLKGLSERRIVLVHALPNAIAPTIQVIGLTFLYLAGGIVVVEYVFAYPGVGQGLVNAVSNRDLPVIQFTVVVLAAFYVVMNIGTDLLVLAVTPRRRLPR